MGCGSSSQSDAIAAPAQAPTQAVEEAHVIDEIYLPSDGKMAAERQNKEIKDDPVVSTASKVTAENDRVHEENIEMAVERTEAHPEALVEVESAKEVVKDEPPLTGEATTSVEEISIQTQIDTSSSQDTKSMGDITRHMDRVYEYERWQPFVLWGNSFPGHMLPTDPGW
jgi:hypothetical protein